MNHWLTLFASLSTENATVRMRAWRALKACGATVLHDGVYLMPERCQAMLDSLAADVREGGGTALVLRIEEPKGGRFHRAVRPPRRLLRLADRDLAGTHCAGAVHPHTGYLGSLQ